MLHVLRVAKPARVAGRRTWAGKRRANGRVRAAQRVVHQGGDARVQGVRAIAAVPIRRAVHRGPFRRGGPGATVGTVRRAVPVDGRPRVQSRRRRRRR